MSERIEAVNPMSDEEAAEYMKKIGSDCDTEIGHLEADDFLCDLLRLLGYHKTVEAFEQMEKWYA